MRSKYLLLFICIVSAFISKAETIIEESHEHEYKHIHEHRSEEFGIATGPVYLVSHEEWVAGLHVHYVYRIFPNPKFGLGLGYEHLFDEHKHNFIGLIGAYNPIEHLAFTLAPGIVFEGETREKSFALHFETLYEFELGSFHLGPVAGMGYSPEDLHLSLGVHFAYSF
jgi:hypothetical protein